MILVIIKKCLDDKAFHIAVEGNLLTGMWRREFVQVAVHETMEVRSYCIFGLLGLRENTVAYVEA